MQYNYRHLLGTSISALAMLVSLSVGAQEQADDIENKGTQVLEELIVTGTSVSRSASDLPLSVTSLDDEQITRFGTQNQADILRNVPGLRAEGGGGEVAVNLRVRGLPSAGQFQYTPLQYDGVPIFNTFGLNSSSFDVLFRTDLGISKLEFVRGGVSNLFGSSSVAGVLNYRSKNGQDDPGSKVQLELAEEGRARFDFYNGGQLGDSTYYALSGFYREDSGAIDTGLDTEGGQLRGNIKHIFDDGSLTVSAQLIDDGAQFFLPYPLADGGVGNRRRPTGNDGRTIFTTNSPEAADLGFNTPAGRFDTPIEDGVITKGGFIALDYQKEFGEGWSLNTKAKLADYDHEFNLFLNGDGLGGLPFNTNDYLNSLGYGQFIDSAVVTNARTGRLLSSTDLIYGNRILDRVRDAEEATAEINLSKAFDIGGATHTVTAGLFYADSEALDVNYITTFAAEFSDQAPLVDVRVGDQILIDAGLVAGAQTNDRVISAKRTAFYLTDQIESENWVVDLGVRTEKLEGDINIPSFTSVPFNITGKSNIVAGSRLLTSTVRGPGNVGSVEETATGFSVGALYRLNDVFNVYANYSDGFFFPQLRSVGFTNGSTQPYDNETIEQTELGVKFNTGRIEGSIAYFKTDLSNRITVNTINDPTAPGGIRFLNSEQSTEADGIEAYANFTLSDRWSVNTNLIVQDHEFVQDDTTPSNIGNEISRLPTSIFNLGLFYDDDTFDAAIYGTNQSDVFGNDANTQELDSYTLWSLDLGYTKRLANDSSLRFSLNVYNVGDSDGLTEGNPRAAAGTGGGAGFFVGRPELPRRVTFRVAYDF